MSTDLFLLTAFSDLFLILLTPCASCTGAYQGTKEGP